MCLNRSRLHPELVNHGTDLHIGWKASARFLLAATTTTTTTATTAARNEKGIGPGMDGGHAAIAAAFNVNAACCVQFVILSILMLLLLLILLPVICIIKTCQIDA
ncbi:hypothetical protein AWZ03_008824 [Drosophila navojoa]|uniref:Uncharacterized protein n=1 Tax=Drosophila navojoa TaxID=7232 RepID=A0A484B7V0_DRONA|nr:hypothetical protein AWZ03_008824 [Drosophila navojoa]